MKHYKPNLSKSERVAQNLFLLVNGGRLEIDPNEILYLEADINYTRFHMLGKKFVTSFHLKFFEQVLINNPQFLRINKSNIVNLDFLTLLNWDKDCKEAQLCNGIKLPISRRKAHELKEVLFDNLEVISQPFN